MELIDLYDEKRQFTGEQIVRGEEIRSGRYKVSVHMWIMNSKGEVYIQKRAVTRKLFPGKWENPGGGVVSGQTSEESLKREFEEELGIKFQGDFVLIETIKRTKDFVDIYCVKQDFEICELNLQEEEVCESMWVGLSKLKSMIDVGLFCPTIYDSYIPFLEYVNQF